MSESYPIKIWSGLLSDGHVQKIENALWEFIWLVGKVTKEEDGKGYVLGGTPIKINDICKDLKRNYKTVYRHLKQLEKYGYISTIRSPHGLIITVNKSKKFNHKNIERLDKNDKARLDKNVQTDEANEEVIGQKCPRDWTKMSERLDKNVHSIILDTKDTKDNKYIYISPKKKPKKKKNEEEEKLIKEVFDYWNKKEIIIHKKLDDATKSKIEAKLKDYSRDEILGAINNYAFILHNPKDYWFNYKWTLKDFLQRGLEKFKDWEVASENYLRKDKLK